MTVVTTTLVIIGGAVALLAGVGVLRFDSTYARLHAAGKASPVAFLIAAIGAGIELGSSGTALILASVAMVLTLPIGVHLMFRAVHRTTSGHQLVVDQLSEAMAAEAEPGEVGE